MSKLVLLIFATSFVAGLHRYAASYGYRGVNRSVAWGEAWRTSAMVLIILGVLVMVSGCEDRGVARKRNEEKLPPGCRIVDLDYGDLRAAVVCDGRKSTTALREWQSTVYVPMTVGGTTIMQPQTQYHRSITAVIE